MSQLELIPQNLIAHTPLISPDASVIAQGELLHIAPTIHKPKTLILDMDETLVHSSFTMPEHYDFEIYIKYGQNSLPIYIQKRPGVDSFLKNIMGSFDIYIFTASMPEYSIPVIKQLIPNFPESRILSRKHCRLINGSLVKDLTIFKRDLSNLIIIDNSPSCYQLQPSNGIPIPSWTGDYNDNILTTIIEPFLALCLTVSDVRPLISAAFLSS